MKPFKVEWTKKAADALKAQVRSYRFPDQPGDSGWSHGCDAQTLRDLCAYWAGEFDFEAMVRELNRFAQFTAEIDGQTLHFVPVRGEPDPIATGIRLFRETQTPDGSATHRNLVRSPDARGFGI